MKMHIFLRSVVFPISHEPRKGSNGNVPLKKCGETISFVFRINFKNFNFYEFL